MKKCPECGNEYQQIGTHWRYNSDHRVQFTQKQQEIIAGLLMGDGSLYRGNKNPYIQCDMISKNYLEFLHDEFGILSNGVKFHISAEDNAQRSRDSGFSPDAKAENYSDQYRWTTISHPQLHNWNWYGTGKKVWPADIELTPTVLKHWYCGDGHFNNAGSNKHIQIAMSNESENTEKVTEMFKRAGFSTSNYNIIGNVCDLTFTVDESQRIFDYMGDPLPGFEYKWP